MVLKFKRPKEIPIPEPIPKKELYFSKGIVITVRNDLNRAGHTIVCSRIDFGKLIIAFKVFQGLNFVAKPLLSVKLPQFPVYSCKITLYSSVELRQTRTF